LLFGDLRLRSARAKDRGADRHRGHRRAGKSTQARTLIRRLRVCGFEAAVFREPTRGRWGREIRRCAKEAGRSRPSRSSTSSSRIGGIMSSATWPPPGRRPDRRPRPVLLLVDRLPGRQGPRSGAGPEAERAFRYPSRPGLRPGPRPGLGLARIAGRKTRDRLFEREAYLRKVRRIFRSLRAGCSSTWTPARTGT